MQVINFLLTTEIIPLCLRIMESGSELSKTVATFILQKVFSLVIRIRSCYFFDGRYGIFHAGVYSFLC